MGDFLDTIITRTEADLARRMADEPIERLEERMAPASRGRPFSEALVAEGISLIAEMKRASPSKGPIRPGASVGEVVRTYEAAGASACSVLTEGPHFQGSLDDLAEARAACSLPLLRKDFIVHRYQLVEARLAGADAALLIVAVLGAERLAELLSAAGAVGLDCLVEVHDEDEVDVAISAGAEILGVNNRNLRTFDVDLDTTFRLLPEIPAGTVVVAESGITARDDVVQLETAGVDAMLVGETLMRADDPAEAIHELLGR